MPVFSFTAPHITPEQEELERRNLTAEEVQRLENDLHGHVGGNNDRLETPERMEQAVEKVMEFIAEAPMPSKKDYVEAKEKCSSHVLAVEANPIKFLRCDDYQPEAAAIRMLAYWKMRRKLFGPVMAFQPITLDSMSDSDREICRSGIVMMHPKDEFGRGVIWLDRIRSIPPFCPRDAAIRVMMYFLQVLSEDPVIQSEGFVTLVNIKGYDLYKHFDRLFTKQITSVMHHTMPVKLKAAHLLAGNASGVMSLVMPVMKHLVQREVRLRIVVHSGRDEVILKELKSFGLASHNVSHTMGGDIRPEYSEHWYLERSQQEEAEAARREG